MAANDDLFMLSDSRVLPQCSVVLGGQKKTPRRPGNKRWPSARTTPGCHEAPDQHPEEEEEEA